MKSASEVLAVTQTELLRNARDVDNPTLAKWIFAYARQVPSDADWALLTEVGHRLYELAAKSA